MSQDEPANEAHVFITGERKRERGGVQLSRAIITIEVDEEH